MQEQDRVFYTVTIVFLSWVHESLLIPSSSCPTQKHLTLWCVCTICVDLFHTFTFINHIIINIIMSTFTLDTKDLVLYGTFGSQMWVWLLENTEQLTMHMQVFTIMVDKPYMQVTATTVYMYSLVASHMLHCMSRWAGLNSLPDSTFLVKSL